MVSLSADIWMTLLLDICNSCSKVGLLLVGVVMMISGDVEMLLYGVVIIDCDVLLFMLVLCSLMFLCFSLIVLKVVGIGGKL